MRLVREPLDVDFVIAPNKISKKKFEELDMLIAKLKSKKKSVSEKSFLKGSKLLNEKNKK